VKSELASGSLIAVEDSFRIVGNPRNEMRYFSEGKNDRWKRNPRVGNYQLKLVVCTASDLKQIPLEIQNISLKKNERFLNPFYYFNYGLGKKLKETLVINDPVFLNVYAKPDLGAGIFIKSDALGTDKYNKSYFCNTCGENEDLYRNAPLQQFINYVDSSTKFNNIPLLKDILKDDYTQIDYNWDKSFYTH
jgi:hypothetical protein